MKRLGLNLNILDVDVVPIDVVQFDGKTFQGSIPGGASLNSMARGSASPVMLTVKVILELEQP